MFEFRRGDYVYKAHTEPLYWYQATLDERLWWEIYGREGRWYVWTGTEGGEAVVRMPRNWEVM